MTVGAGLWARVGLERVAGMAVVVAVVVVVIRGGGEGKVEVINKAMTFWIGVLYIATS